MLKQYPPNSNLPVYQVSDWRPDLKQRQIAEKRSGFYSIELAGRAYEYQGAERAYALTEPAANWYRQELRRGDQHVWDATVGHNVARNELSSRDSVAAIGQPVQVTQTLRIEPGPRNTASWLVLQQLRQLPLTLAGSPPVSLCLEGERFCFVARWDSERGQHMRMVWKASEDLNRGQNYRLTIRALAHRTFGWCELEVDGVLVGAYHGRLGYFNSEQQTGFALATGIYRDNNAVETLATVRTVPNVGVSPVIFQDKR